MIINLINYNFYFKTLLQISPYLRGDVESSRQRGFDIYNS